MTKVAVGWGEAKSELVWVEMPHQDGWWITAIYAITDGEPTLAELRIIPGDGREQDEDAHDFGEWSLSLAGLASTSAPLTSRLLRDISLTKLKEATKPGLRRMNLGTSKFRAIADSFIASGTKPGRKGNPDEHYLPVAIRYAELVASGDRSPVATLASQLQQSQSQARDLIHETRRRGLLTKGQQGRSAGVLTEKALNMVNKGAKRGKR
jgi:hypothetical protein